MGDANNRKYARYKINGSLLCDVFEVANSSGFLSRLFAKKRNSTKLTCRIIDISEFGLGLSLNKDIELSLQVDVEVRFDGEIFDFNSLQVRNKTGYIVDGNPLISIGLGSQESLSELINELVSKGKISALAD